MNKIVSKIVFTALALLTIMACEPNTDLYEQLDNDKLPFNNKEKPVEYTLVTEDYNRFRGFVQDYDAFSDSIPAMDFVPDVLKVRLVTYRENSRALVTFNHFMVHPDWWDAGFGYKLTNADYATINIDNAFSESTPANQFIPSFLFKKFPEAEEDDQLSIIYKFDDNGEIRLDIDTYEFTGSDWLWLETRENIPYAGYELTPDDYKTWDGDLALQGRFSENFPPEQYLPGLLNILFPEAPVGAVQVLKYRMADGSSTVNKIDKYEYDGAQWHMTPYTTEKTEQYIFGALGWAFDPTVKFQISKDDYFYLAQIDPLPHETFNDFGYYYGASSYYGNFDIRLIGRRLNKDGSGNYRDPELGAIYENEGEEAAMDEMLRRIVEDGIIQLLQYKYPNATPQVGGIDVNYFVNFQTFADNWVRRFPEAHYICTAAGSPPQFELVEGPYYPLEEE